MTKAILISVACVVLLVAGYAVYNYHFYVPTTYEDCLEHKRYPLMTMADSQIVDKLCRRFPNANAEQQKAERIAAQQEAEKARIAEAKRYELLQVQFREKVSAVHPDWKSIVDSPTFHQWIEFYPDVIIKEQLKTAYKRGSAEEIIWMLTRYKTELQQGKRTSNSPGRTGNSPAKTSNSPNFFDDPYPFGDLLRGSRK